MTQHIQASLKQSKSLFYKNQIERDAAEARRATFTPVNIAMEFLTKKNYATTKVYLLWYPQSGIKGVLR